MAVLWEITEIMTDHSENFDIVENTAMVSAVSTDNGCALLEEMLTELVKDTSLSSYHQDLLLALLMEYSDVFA